MRCLAPFAVKLTLTHSDRDAIGDLLGVSTPMSEMIRRIAQIPRATTPPRPALLWGVLPMWKLDAHQGPSSAQWLEELLIVVGR